MERASCIMVLFMSSGTALEARQNFRFKPKSSLEPGGRLLTLQRLWKVKFLGCRKRWEGALCIATSKFFWRVVFGSAMNPKLVRHLFSTDCSNGCVCRIVERFLCFSALLFRLWANLLDVIFLFDFSVFGCCVDLKTGWCDRCRFASDSQWRDSGWSFACRKGLVGSTKCFENCWYLSLGKKSDCKQGLTCCVVIGADMGFAHAA